LSAEASAEELIPESFAIEAQAESLSDYLVVAGVLAVIL
jgi:hypothetical protein